MVTVKGSLGSATTLTVTLTSLANNAGRSAAQYDGGTNFPTKGLLSVKMKPGANPVEGQRLEFHLAFSDSEGTENITDGSDTDYGITTSDAALATKPINVQSIGAIAMSGTGNTTHKKVIPLFDLPQKWSLIAWNTTGDALSSTEADFVIKFIPQYDATV
jgi:hypothetical protein